MRNGIQYGGLIQESIFWLPQFARSDCVESIEHNSLECTTYGSACRNRNSGESSSALASVPMLFWRPGS